LDKILSDNNLTKEEKGKQCLQLINDAETEVLKNKNDGEISIDQYGNFEFKLYEEIKPEEETKSSDGVSKVYCLCRNLCF
jgi:hypothetical protein